MKRIPIGLSDFKHLIEEDFYYFDKTKFIDEIIQDGAQVKLFTRPRRFGKTLNISMLKYFFDVENNKHENRKLFKNLKISKTEKGRSSKDRDIKNILKLEIAFYDCQQIKIKK